MKPFDDQLADNVRQAFDHYHEAVDPRALARLQQQLQQRRRRRVIALWPPRAWAGIAASVLLMVAAWQLWHHMPAPPQQAQPRVVHTQPPTPPQQPGREAVAQKPVNPAAAPPPRQQLVAAAPRPDARQDRGPRQAATNRPDEAQPESPREAPVPSARESQPPSAVVLPPLNPQGDNPSAALMAALHPAALTEPQPPHHSSQSWSVTAGPMLAFAPQGISDGPGIAAGVLSEWNLAPGITLMAGGLLTYHQFELVSHRHSDDFFAHVPGNDFSGEILVPGTSSYELLALDIPLNAQFDLAASPKHRLYLSTGLSSVLFLREHFTDNNTLYTSQQVINPATGQISNTISSEALLLEEKTNPFSRFDAARLLNLSMGYVINGQRGATIIEPFVKIPLGSITSRNLNLGMGGITIRYNFQKKGTL